jgi:UDP-N-acetylmuramate dehydrogenase
MELKTNISLKPYNTFGIDVTADHLIVINNESDLKHVISQKYSPLKIIGGGSNILLTKPINGYVLKNEIKGIEIINEDQDIVTVKVGAGEKWHQFVMWSLSHHLGGIENLALIPGSVGAAPMQNIGAYGIEQENAFCSLQAMHLETGEKKVFSKMDCQFGYRDSVFKNHLKNQYFITHVTYTLKKTNIRLHLEYGAIKDILNQKQITEPTIVDVSEAVIEIRKSKLPDPLKVGNAGSFFKNPVVAIEQYYALQKAYPAMPHYPVSDEEVKIPAGWLIEKAGFKGKKFGHVGVHSEQALVLINFGGGTGHEIQLLASQIQESVKDMFNIDIYPEVNYW